MNTLHFEYAVEVERTQSITKAAENLFMAQPNLSKAIKELEDTLGYVVFERTPRGAIPTEKGGEFLLYARNVLAEIKKMESLKDQASPDKRRFGIAISGSGYIWDALTKFISEHNSGNEFEVNINETNSMQVIDDIVTGRFNLGVIRFETMHEKYFLDYLREKKLHYDAVWESEFLIFMSVEHPLSSVEKIKPDVLGQYPRIIYADTTIPYLPSGKTSACLGREQSKTGMYIQGCCSRFDLLSRLPFSYMWDSPVPSEWLARYNLIQRKCNTRGNVFKDLLIYPEGYEPSYIEKSFIEKLNLYTNELVTLIHA